MSEQYSKKQTELSALEDENKITPNGLAEFMEDNDTLFVKLLKKNVSMFTFNRTCNVLYVTFTITHRVISYMNFYH
mgnify:CR=1 FL=1